MKFVSAVTALVAAMAVGTEAAKAKVSRRELNQRMKNGQFDKKTLLGGAKPNNDAAKKRRLGNDEEYYFTGDHSIQFKSCFSLTTSYADMFEGDDEGSTIMTLFSQGQLMAIESYAIFTLYYSTAGTAEEYVVSLDTYLESLVNYLPNQVEEYCEACKENYDTCYNQMYGQYGNNANNNVNYNAYDNNYNGNNVNNVNYNYGGRKLLEVERVLNNGAQVVRQLDCGLCQEYGCVDFSSDDEKEGEDQNGFETASEWLEEISQCKETGVSYQGGYQNGGGYYYNQQNGDEAEGEGLFAGMICNGDGTGVEIGLFYDDECKLYLPNESFQNYMSYYDKTYLEMTKEVIEFTFSDAIFSCKEQEVVYTTQDVGDYGNQYYGNYDWNENADADDIAEWCEGVLMSDDGLVDMRSCGNGGNGNGYYYSKYNYGGYDDDEVTSQMATYDWYRFEISEDDAEDLTTVCGVARRDSMHTFYNTNNGNLYSYGSSSSDADFLESSSIKSGPSAGAVFGWIIFVGLAAGAGVALFMKFQADSAEDKNVALIDPEEVEQKGGEVA
eukprot:CAMPEP_0116129060 /NCGR_PEP_ID=MMETSP0329-20121206/7729_1 /TAXON_ID=697910 /ORGANISM="Pseudo-nitzschia arenysensis, Strain B593" /LENGTH=553 /DNA_ID=CAMNT_0003623315 /DNA_START=53 /DNA_END=1714 /DNA_ORIENTATION=+